MSDNSTDNISAREIMNDIIGGSGEGALSQGCLATSASPFMIDIKKIVVNLNNMLSRSVAKRPRDDSPVLVIDTEEGTNAMSYRDALVAAAPELDLPKPTDLVIPGANRLIVKLKKNENLEKLKKMIEGDPNLGKLAQAKISKHKKHRLILFGVPDSITDDVFKKEVEALEDTMGRPIEIIKSFKNGKVITDNKNYIIDVDAQVAQKLINLGKFVINFNRLSVIRVVLDMSQSGEVMNTGNDLDSEGDWEDREDRILKEKDRSDFIEISDKIFFACMKAEANYLLSHNKIKDLEEEIGAGRAKIKDLESQLSGISEKNVTLESIEDKRQKLVEEYGKNQTRIQEFINCIPEGSPSERSLGNEGKKENSQVLVIDTNDGATALSYRDALIAKAPELKLPNPADLLMPGTSRLIVKMKDIQNLEKFKQIIDNDPNLGTLAQSKISKQKKFRLILFGVPDYTNDEELKSYLESLGETGGRPVEIVKSFKNGKRVTDTKHYIVDVDSRSGENLVNLSRIIIHFNRVRIKKYFNYTRCFKCQRFGHTANSCKWTGIFCAGCGGKHDTRVCTSSTTKCINCLEGQYKNDSNHRADDRVNCKSFLDYKASLISKNKYE
ncbi:hypothetical protein JTE90_002304 [Oedothorax gibbosus]|uniref:CCHC-type domain-containing protein n=1 Tax=Oedothorax gibbosus TaxID=931172 RepID=A0AAV6UK15_9ARAC|nr:hypothetical protein JTE90_002304 [Oedothorax gibbosus]